MSNNQTPFSYVPASNLLTPPNNQLRHIRLLPAIWNQNAPLPNWSRIQTTVNLDALRKNRREYWLVKLDYAYRRDILASEKISESNKALIRNLFLNYYLSVLSPSNYGVYLDCQGLMQDILNTNDNKRIEKMVTRYADAVSAACMFGIFSAQDNRVSGKFSKQAIRAKSLFLDICALPMDAEFNPTSPYTETARLEKLQAPLVYLPFEQLKAEVTLALGQTAADGIDFVNNITNSKKDIPTIIPDFWLDTFDDALQAVNDDNSRRAFTYTKK
ncbi:MAG: hypothetical protein IJQ55_02215 [Alphaproteobacteria bacterium]|nr:hypothetical protein [Alphaproteobacteria bacterium]